MRTKALDAAVSEGARHVPKKRRKARLARIAPERERLYFKGRRVYTEDERKHMACPYPPEPEWVAALEEAAERREKGGSGT